MSTRKQLLLDSLVFARDYTVSLLETVPPAQWFTMPPGSPTHIAWQVGHLAMAEARMALDRICGHDSVGAGLLIPNYVELFGRQSTADADARKYPTAQAIRAMYDRVHHETMRLLPSIAESDLDALVGGPQHRFCRTKFDFLRWVSHHEMIHAGQIGLLRRMLGNEPVW